MASEHETMSLPTGRLLSVQVGVPELRKTAQGRKWESAIVKRPVDGPVFVSYENLHGDKQANLKYHGGPTKAVCAYSSENFARWKEEFALEMAPGAFGENITVESLTEDKVCLGDVLAIGAVRLQISQPRMPCANVAKRWDCARLPERMMETGYTGFYCQVLETGDIEAGREILILERPLPDWTILRCNQTLYSDGAPAEEIEALRALPELTGEWKRGLGRRLRRLQGST